VRAAHKSRELKDFEKEKQGELSAADHRFLGQQLELFSIDDDVGVGLVLWHPKGTAVRNVIRDFWEKEHRNNGYQLVCTPHIAREELWRISGHLDYYAENMYWFQKDDESYVVKPMNCPLHVQIYRAKPRSYRELPIRYAEWGTVYRYERSGTMHGLLRVRGFTQDDAHIFCTYLQVEDEILRLLDFSLQTLRRFGFTTYKAFLSTRAPSQPEKYMGSDKKWQLAQNALARALAKEEIPYTEAQGEAVFYGPKIDLKIVDAAGREWQCTTIQFDFNLPKRFKANYVGNDNKIHEVVMIHRALLGSVERFFAILLEHYGGNLPTWLAPVQVSVVPVGSNQIAYAKGIYDRLREHGIRAEFDESSSTVSYRIRQAELAKIPYMIICGKHEAERNSLSVRRHGTGNIGELTLEQFLGKVRDELQ
jgi:threonyl-tRNA synthetase